MYKVMIIDDEKALRSLLRKTIRWEELGLTLCGEAASGIEAINIIDDIRPDIVFVDIRMPFMDGIEFSKLAIKRYPQLKILILTAFDDFQYAKECIGIGVCDYLLKPIVREDIYDALHKVIKRLNEEEFPDLQDQTAGERDNIQMNQIKQYLKQHYRDSELNLTAVAREFGFNASYLSRKFKEETGQGFTDYLLGIRIEHACRLAVQGELMYRTAALVGIPDPNYFGKCFKKSKGVSYSEFGK